MCGVEGRREDEILECMRKRKEKGGWEEGEGDEREGKGGRGEEMREGRGGRGEEMRQAVSDS